MAKSDLAQSRMGAWLIDAALVVGLGILFNGLGWIASMAYWLLRDGLFEGQSISKRLMGLKVVLVKGKGRCTFKESAIRNFLWVVPFVDFFMLVTGLYYVMNDPTGRHWGDRLADTRVLKA